MIGYILQKAVEIDDIEVLSEEITRTMISQGFNGNDIDIALALAFRLKQKLIQFSRIEYVPRTELLFKYLEEMKISSEARGYLMELQNNGFITAEEKDQVVEKVVFSDMEDADLNTIKAIVNYVLFGDDDPEGDIDREMIKH